MDTEEIISRIKVVDDFFPVMIHAQIKQDIFKSPAIPWSFHHRISSLDKRYYGKKWLRDGEAQDSYGFNYAIDFENNQDLHYLKTGLQGFLKKKLNIEVKEFLRSMAVILPPEPFYKQGNYMPPHVDFDTVEGTTNLLYYLDDSEGDTLFFDHYFDGEKELLDRTEFKIVQRIAPKKNRMVVFDSWILHSGGVPQFTKRSTLLFVIR